jgi:hypothetical protein
MKAQPMLAKRCGLSKFRGSSEIIKATPPGITWNPASMKIELYIPYVGYRLLPDSLLDYRNSLQKPATISYAATGKSAVQTSPDALPTSGGFSGDRARAFESEGCCVRICAPFGNSPERFPAPPAGTKTVA